MTILARSKLFQEHQTGNHPECPERLLAFEREFAESEVVQRCTALEPVAAVDRDILAVHSQHLYDVIRHIDERGGGSIDGETMVSDASLKVAIHAAGSLMRCVDEVVNGRDSSALALIRPPGHHATRNKSMGFCLFNNIAMAAAHALHHHQVDRILIVDWDVHHGNGTQDIFYEDERVFFLSIHRYPFYPGTGSERETGAGKGLGYTLNLPLDYGLPREFALEQFQRGLESAAKRIKPDLILISAGFDGHKDDPLGHLGFETEDYATMTRWVKAIADQYCRGRIVSTLEGGYNLNVLPQCIGAHLKVLLED